MDLGNLVSLVLGITILLVYVIYCFIHYIRRETLVDELNRKRTYALYDLMAIDAAEARTKEAILAEMVWQAKNQYNGQNARQR